MKEPTPAEKLRASIRRKRPKRNPPAKSEHVIWINRVAELREANDLAMRDVAKAVGMSTAAYFRVEKGFADVCLSNACKIATFFGLTVAQVWTEWKGGAK